MNGPNPVCTSATQNVNQSRPRWLRREAAIGGPGGSVRFRAGGGSSPSALRRLDAAFSVRPLFSKALDCAESTELEDVVSWAFMNGHLGIYRSAEKFGPKTSCE